MDLAANITALENRIQAACDRAQRNRTSIQLVAVSKGRPPEAVQAAIREKGIRNVTLLTQAPTGTTGTMVNTSTGIEPFYRYR